MTDHGNQPRDDRGKWTKLEWCECGDHKRDHAKRGGPCRVCETCSKFKGVR